jgi:cell division ATPase FtsA
VGYQLGVDLGTTYTAAAVHRDGKVEMCTLGSASPVMPSVVLLRADGEVLEGEVAVRRGLAEPTRVAREFKRRLGDPAPLVLGGTPYGAEALMGHLLRNVLATVTAREGAAPDRVVLTHPANFGPYKLDMMREVARLAGCDLDATVFITEPEAAALSYAARNRVEPGQIVAVYDFGGGTFDAALVRRTESGFSLIGKPEGMERFGGIDIDAAIVSHVDQSLGGAIARLDTDDVDAQAAVSRLRDDCRQAKEALSGDTDTSITVSVPGTQTNVRLTRQELEDMVRPRLRETVEALQRAVRSAGLTMSEISRILLVGGSSRIPLVAETLQRDTGRPVAVDAHPKFAIAMGAAGYQADAPASATATGAESPVLPTLATQPVAPPPKPEPLSAESVMPMPAGLPSLASGPSSSTPTVAPSGAPAGRPPEAPPPPPPQVPPARTGAPPPAPSAAAPPRKRKGALIGAGIAVAAALGVGGVLALGGGDGASPERTDESRPRRTDPPETDPSTTVEEPTTTAGPVEETMSIEQINASVVTSADIAADWVQVQFVPSGNAAICGQTLPNTAEVAGGSAFQRTVNGQQQALVNDIESYATSAQAIENFQTLRSILTNCPSFDLTDPASGAVITTFVQFFDDTPQPSCQGAASIRLDSESGGTALSTSFFALQVCGANMISTRLDLPPFPDALPDDLRNEWIGSLLASTDRVVAISQFEGTGGGGGTSDTVPSGIVTRENFLDLLSIGAGIEVTQEMEDCFVQQTSDLTQDDFDAALSDSPPDDVTTAIGLALVVCKVPLEV